MSDILAACLLIYGLGIFGIFMWILMDEADDLKDLLSVRHMDVDAWIKTIWCIIFWPVIVIFVYFRYGFIPTIKFLYKFVKFGLKLIFYPFKLIFNFIKPKNSEPLQDKIGKFIVKVFKL